MCRVRCVSFALWACRHDGREVRPPCSSCLTALPAARRWSDAGRFDSASEVGIIGDLTRWRETTQAKGIPCLQSPLKAVFYPDAGWRPNVEPLPPTDPKQLAGLWDRRVSVPHGMLEHNLVPFASATAANQRFSKAFVIVTPRGTRPALNFFPHIMIYISIMESYKFTLYTTTCRIVMLPRPPFSLVVEVQGSIASPPPCGDPVCFMIGLGTGRTLPHVRPCVPVP